MRDDVARARESVDLAATLAQHEAARWRCTWKVEKYLGEVADGILDEVIEGEGNLLVTAGITALLTLLIGGGGTAFNNANAYLGVGDSSTAAAIGQTDLQAATNKLRKAMDATYPSVATDTVTFKSTFGTSEANFAWAEWGTFNASSAGTMLNRKVSALGTKTSAGSWVLTVTITIA